MHGCMVSFSSLRCLIWSLNIQYVHPIFICMHVMDFWFCASFYGLMNGWMDICILRWIHNKCACISLYNCVHIITHIDNRQYTATFIDHIHSLSCGDSVSKQNFYYRCTYCRLCCGQGTRSCGICGIGLPIWALGIHIIWSPQQGHPRID